MSSNPPVTEETVGLLAAVARLHLSPERCAQLAPQLSALVAAANELSAKLANGSGGRRSIPPIVGFPER
jgi:Asp-tRNA(Asn)/Glu-tRNA(Gln) amidotransferase C subunit